MTDMLIAARAGLAPHEHEQVVRLRDVCERRDGLDLKIELTAAATSSSVNSWLAYSGQELVGYCGLDVGPESEVCGMVHPDHRGGRVGTRLLDAVLAAAADAGMPSVLVICEDAFTPAIEWLRRRGAVLAQSEDRMLLPLNDATLPDVVAARMTPAGDADRSMLARILADGFGETADDIEDRLAHAAPWPNEETFLAYDGDLVTGTTRVITKPRRSMIYGFVVDPALRGRGHGASMLRATLDLLRRRGAAEAGLEVDPDNTPAVRLYRRFGFRTVTTYRYMRLMT